MTIFFTHTCITTPTLCNTFLTSMVGVLEKQICYFVALYRKTHYSCHLLQHSFKYLCLYMILIPHTVNPSKNLHFSYKSFCVYWPQSFFCPCLVCRVCYAYNVVDLLVCCPSTFHSPLKIMKQAIVAKSTWNHG